MEHDIVMDLLPLYHDGVCSDASRAAVEAHLQTCDICREALKEMDAPLPAAEAKKNAADGAAVKKISEEWKKSKWKARVKGAVIAAAVCLVLVGTWLAATQLYLFPVPAEKIQITNVRQLSDGRVLYHFSIDDDRNLRRIRFEYDEEGNKYYVPVRALITEKRWDGVTSADREMALDVAEENAWAESQGIDREVTRVWYGRGEDAILLWEEGMDLPAASEADEAAWGYEPGSAEYWAARENEP